MERAPKVFLASIGALATVLGVFLLIDERNPLVVTQSFGHIEHGGKFGVHIGDTEAAARRALSRRGIHYAYPTDNCAESPRPQAAEQFTDDSWRLGFVCLGVRDGRVIQIGWAYGIILPLQRPGSGFPGTWERPRRTPYSLLPELLPVGANSNSATAALEYHALDIGDVPNAARVIADHPSDTPGWNQYRRIPWR